MRKASSGDRSPAGGGILVSPDPGDWSPEYRELAAGIEARFGSAIRGRPPVPPILELHPGPSCPAGCRFCPTRGTKLYPPERRRAPLSAEELRILVKDFAVLGGETVVLSGGLEPLAGPAVATAVACAEAGLEVHLYTSGLSAVLDDPDERRALLRSAARIRFSVNGLSEASYADVQLGGGPRGRLLGRVQDRIEALLRDRAGLRGATPAIGMSFLAVADRAAEVGATLDYCERIGLDFLDVLVDITGDREVPPALAAQLDALRRLSGRRQGRLVVRVSGRTGTAPALARRCAAPRVKVAVDPYGFAWRCCYVANPELSSPDLLLGDVRADGLRAVMQSEALEPRETRCASCPDFERTLNSLAER